MKSRQREEAAVDESSVFCSARICSLCMINKPLIVTSAASAIASADCVKTYVVVEIERLSPWIKPAGYAQTRICVSRDWRHTLSGNPSTHCVDHRSSIKRVDEALEVVW
jgi:hypothetical protein